MTVPVLNGILHGVIVVLIIVGFLAARYEGACWAHRRPEQSWWGILRPDRLFRSDLYTPEGDRLRRVAVRYVLLFLVIGLLLAVGILYRNALESGGAAA